MRKGLLLPAIAAALLVSSHAMAASVTIDFENLNDNGFGLKFSNDASKDFPIVNIGGSNRMEVARSGGFQEADRGSAADAWFNALAAGVADESYVISYDWYVDTSLSPGNYGNFLQLATYLNSGTGAYIQDFPGVGKDVELSGTQLGSGQVFSGTVSETFTAKYGALGAGFQAQTFLRLGFIENGDGAQAKVYYDNITIGPAAALPEPGVAALLGFACPLLVARRRR